MTGNNDCTVTIPGAQNRVLPFDVIENRAQRGFTMPAGATGKSIQFYLMKIDDWEGDYLDIYANDLLVKRLQYGGSGSNFCGLNNQGDQISLQQLDL